MPNNTEKERGQNSENESQDGRRGRSERSRDSRLGQARSTRTKRNSSMLGCKPEETDPRNCAVEGRKFDQEKPRP